MALVANEDLQPSFFDLAFAVEAERQEEGEQNPVIVASANDNPKPKVARKKEWEEHEKKAVKSREERTRDRKEIEL